MSHYMQMLLNWARADRDFAWIAHGWMLRDDYGDQRIDPVERQYVRNIIMARLKGISA